MYELPSYPSGTDIILYFFFRHNVLVFSGNFFNEKGTLMALKLIFITVLVIFYPDVYLTIQIMVGKCAFGYA
jgi:hypothetical protein